MNLTPGGPVMALHKYPNLLGRNITAGSKNLMLDDGKVYNVAHDTADVLGARRRCLVKVMIHEGLAHLFWYVSFTH
jgi:hypothetical protein